jgi:hypothetical protein
MIHVTVEIVPFGMEDQKRVIGTAEITNPKTGGRELGNYQAWVRDAYGEVLHDVSVEGFRRLEIDVWGLIYRVLKIPYGRKQKKKVWPIDQLLEMVSSFSPKTNISHDDERA